MESPYLTLAVILCFAAFWYRGAVFENVAPWRWVLPSLLVSFALPALTGGGWGWVVIANAGLFVAITLWRVYRDERDEKR